VYNREKHRHTRKYFWNNVARIELDSTDEVNWTHTECGENFERCDHYAWKHFPELEGKSNLGMQTFLGRCAFQMRDAIGFIVIGFCTALRLTSFDKCLLSFWWGKLLFVLSKPTLRLTAVNLI
jgi:hypothetical protein